MCEAYLVHALGLSKAVDLSTNDTGKSLLGESVRDGLAYAQFAPVSVSQLFSVLTLTTTMPTILALTVLEELHSLKGSSSADEFVRELGLVWSIAVVVAALVDLLVSILRFICVESERSVAVQDR